MRVRDVWCELWVVAVYNHVLHYLFLRSIADHRLYTYHNALQFLSLSLILRLSLSLFVSHTPAISLALPDRSRSLPSHSANLHRLRPCTRRIQLTLQPARPVQCLDFPISVRRIHIGLCVFISVFVSERVNESASGKVESLIFFFISH